MRARFRHLGVAVVVGVMLSPVVASAASSAGPKGVQRTVYDSFDGDYDLDDYLQKWNNGFGLFLRDAAHGTVQDNKSFGNCVGVLFLNVDESQAPPEDHVPVIENRDWLAKHNNVTANNRACPASDEGPPVSGVSREMSVSKKTMRLVRPKPVK